MSEGSRDTGASVDMAQEQRRFPRSLEQHRLFLIYESQRFQAETVDISKTGMLVACPVVPPNLDRGSEVLFELIWSPEPEANTFLRARIMRVIRDSDFDNVLLGVEFSAALARDPAALRGFLERVIGIEHGAIRVVKDSSGKKSLVFDFQSVHREGTERLRALQSSLFDSIDDLDEADRLLEGFGTGEYLFSPESTGPGPAATQPAAPKPAETKPAATEPAAALDPVEASTVVAKRAAPPPPSAAPDNEPASSPPKKKKKEKKKKSTKEKRTYAPGTKPSLLKALIPSFGKKAEKGGDVIPPIPVRVRVANIEGLDVEFMIDGKRRRARATRLYCAGVKCEVESGLPELYRSVVLIIPSEEGKKGEVTLNGDITRVRPAPDSEERGIFEIRLSLRNETGMLNAYRSLVEKLSIGEG